MGTPRVSRLSKRGCCATAPYRTPTIGSCSKEPLGPLQVTNVYIIGVWKEKRKSNKLETYLKNNERKLP